MPLAGFCDLGSSLPQSPWCGGLAPQFRDWEEGWSSGTLLHFPPFWGFLPAPLLREVPRLSAGSTPLSVRSSPCQTLGGPMSPTAFPCSLVPAVLPILLAQGGHTGLVPNALVGRDRLALTAQTRGAQGGAQACHRGGFPTVASTQLSALQPAGPDAHPPRVLRASAHAPAPGSSPGRRSAPSVSEAVMTITVPGLGSRLFSSGGT